ncbi:restriction endonuclease subunit S [Lacihabitans lacunae]|uniref:Restriction endonuclease subunit S n=1 Tax=Lacihabitans lacunae TaxID=1028214 RepID=A0ABV7YV15_9BACT
MEITHLPFLDVTQDITSKFNKIPNKDFINEGEYAIIDQGANIVAGYTNDKSIITDLGYPVIVFGDHTRIIKYVNYPFAIGADGVKVLSVDTEKAYPLYVFYFLKFLKIPNAGYSRHYKFLKDKKIALPKDIDDQKRIAKVLSQCEALIQNRKESIDLLDELLRSTFLEMFGDPVRNEKGWDKDYFDNIVAKDCPLTYGIVQPGIDFPNGVPIVRPVDLTKTFIERKGLKLIDPLISEKFKRTLLKGNEVLMCVRGTTGVVAMSSSELEGCNVTRGIVPIWFTDEYDKYFAYGLLKTRAINHVIQGLTYGATLQQINLSDLRKIKLVKPPIELQNHFGIIYKNVEKIRNQFKESLKELENLYGSISQRAFIGELNLSKVDISDMEDSKKKDLEAVKEDLTEERFEDLLDSFEHTLPTGEVPSNRQTDIRNMSIRQYLRLPDNEETEGIEFSYMNKDFFYQFILTKGFADRTFTLPELEQYARKYILRGTGFEFSYENWKTIIFRFIGAKQPIIEQLFDEEAKTIKLKLTDEAFKV